MNNNLKQSLFSFTNAGGALVAAILLLYLMKPYFVWGEVLNSPQVTSILTLVLGCLFLRQRERGDKSYLFLFLFFFAILLTYVMTNHYAIYFALSFFPVCLLPFAREQFNKNVYNNFLNIYAIIMSVSMVVWFLAITSIIHPFGVIEPLNSLKNYTYFVYPLLVKAPENFRFASVFDEAGVVGTISGLILCIQKFNLKDRRNLIVLLSGLCSLSFFFYALIAVYFLFHYVFVKKSVRSAIVYIAVIGIAFYAITSIDFLNNILGSRFEWNADKGSFAGDNRLGERGTDFFESIVGTEEFWWGVSDKEGYRELVAGSSSFINIVVLNGMVFFVAYLVFWILYGLKIKKTLGTFILFVLAFLATIYQRPFLFHAEFIFLWASLARAKADT